LLDFEIFRNFEKFLLYHGGLRNTPRISP